MCAALEYVLSVHRNPLVRRQEPFKLELEHVKGDLYKKPSIIRFWQKSCSLSRDPVSLKTFYKTKKQSSAIQ
jgi:hypothetical protein